MKNLNIRTFLRIWGKVMDRKILLGSIIAVVILVLVSFTGVVGFQSVKPSTIAKASPLFSVRSKRAIDETSKDIACDYVGKGSILPFPKRDDRTVLVQKFIDSISTMDDETFKIFKILVINYIHRNSEYKNIDTDKINTALHQLGTKPDIIRDFIKTGNGDATSSPEETICNWRPGCILYHIYDIIGDIILGVFLIGLIPFFLLYVLHSVWTQCPTLGNFDPCISYYLPC